MKNLIVDFMFIWNKFYFAMGKNSPAEQIFSSVLKDIEDNKSYDRKIIVLDGKNGSERNKKIFPDYKGGRGDKTEVYSTINDCISRALKTYPSITVMQADEWEADYVISALSHVYSHKGDEVLIFSGDKDLYQLMSLPNVIVTDKYKKPFNLQPYAKEYIISKFKTPIIKDYSDIIKYRIFKGDNSDGIPVAIPRLSTSTIQNIVENWEGNVFNLTKISTQIPNKELQKFEDNKKNLERNWNLMQLVNIPCKQIIKEARVYKYHGNKTI